MEVPDMYTCQELCQVHKEVKALGTFYWNRDAGSRYVYLSGVVSGTHVRLKLWEHSGNRDGGSRYVYLPGDVSGTHVRLYSFGNILGTEMEVPDIYNCQKLYQVHM